MGGISMRIWGMSMGAAVGEGREVLEVAFVALDADEVEVFQGGDVVG